MGQHTDSIGNKVGVVVTKSDGVKCPRCWKYWGIPENYQGCCDVCISSLLEGMDDWVAAGQFTREEADTAIAEIRRLQQIQLQKYRRPNA